MKTPTLGYEEDTEIAKSEIARIQLEEAIALFMSEKFLCALTLAGAAEEVFARLVNARGRPSALEASADAAIELKSKADLEGLAGVTEKNLFWTWNQARNAVKHHSEKESETVVLNMFDEGYWMIKRGLGNAKMLSVHVRNETDFENWIIVNINM